MSKLIVNTQKTGSRINKNIYGHFSEHLGRCIYGGLYVGDDANIPNINGMRSDVVAALKAINLPVLRWPGGCFADEYHWKDGIGPAQNRKKMINSHWGGLVENNTFGTHEFMELCHQLGCEPYVNGNIGSGTVQEMSEWVEYITFDGVSPMADLRRQNGREAPWQLKYFGIGNETWGCGGHMRAEYYADLYRNYQTYVRDYGSNRIYRIASGATDADYHWTKVMMQQVLPFMDGLTLHYYTVPGTHTNKLPATGFTADVYYETLAKAYYTNELLDNHTRIMNHYDPAKKVGLIVDEWGTWYSVEEGTNPGFLYQQNTMRDAMVAAISLNAFNRHSDRVVMANLAQTVNVLQALVLTEGDKMLLTPTYHVFDMYKKHMGATLLESYVQCATIGSAEYTVPQLDVSASQADTGEVHITLANLSESVPQEIEATIAGLPVKKVSARILSGHMDDKNDFNNLNQLTATPFTKLETKQQEVCFTLPACSVLELTVE